MYGLIRPLLFRLDAEEAHRFTLRLLRLASAVPLLLPYLHRQFELADPRLAVQAFGLVFKNPVGLAAGYDKDALAVRGLAALGFGHIEVGTVTLRPQPGNPRPRVFRVPQSQALVNRMGFPNEGVAALQVPRAARRVTRVGVNIGMGKDSPLERAAEEYCELVQRVHAQGDYIALNVSSPNTPGLRDLQSRQAMEPLLREVTRVRDGLSPRVPLLVKIAPDLGWAEIDDVLAAVQATGVDGVIATNTTRSRDGIPAAAQTLEGGLSGAPLRARSTEVVHHIARQTRGRLPIIGAGGVFRAADAVEKLRAGAWLVQVYTGLVYGGPGLIWKINAGLAAACYSGGVESIADLRNT